MNIEMNEATYIREPTIELKERSVLSVRNISYTFPRAEAPSLTDVSFDIHAGETVGVVGDSGSGKTVLLDVLSGIIPHFYKDGMYGGDVVVADGTTVRESDLFEHMSHVKMVFQDPSTQYLGASVDDALAFGMENVGVPREQIIERMNTITENLHIQHLLGRNTQNLSGGELQATSVGSVLAMQPDIILFDEVISALDVAGQERIKSIISTQKSLGKTMVIVDSDVRWLAGTVDRLLIMNKGRLMYDGKPDRIFQDQHLADLSGLERVDTIQPREFHETTPILQVHDVSYSYDGKKSAVDAVSLDVQSGSCTAFVGHNGSGKTTLAELIAGLKKPTSGDIRISDVSPSTMRSGELVRKIGYIYQNPARMFVAETVGQEIAYTPKRIGIEPMPISSEFGLNELLQKSPWELSSGQQQRLAIASVLSVDPDIIIFDEPTLGQTRRDREDLVKTMKALQARDKTIIIISHDMTFVKQAAEYVYEFSQGKIIHNNTAIEYFNHA